MRQFFSFLLAPFSVVYGLIVGLRNRFFDFGFFRSQASNLTVVSIGNLTTGGTGKTPTLLNFAERICARGDRVGVLSRGYRGNYSERCGAMVSTNASHSQELSHTQELKVEKAFAWERYGDEPALIASRGYPVAVARKRIHAVKLLESHFHEGTVINTHSQSSGKGKVILLADDAFQHRWLSRDVDIVVVDSMAKPEEYQLLPWGRLREPLSSLRRAHAVIVTKKNLLSEVELQEFESFFSQRLQPHLGSSSWVLEMDYEMGGNESLNEFYDRVQSNWNCSPVLGGEQNQNSSLQMPLKTLRHTGASAEKKVLLASGLGRNDSFVRLMKKSQFNLSFEIMEFSDHSIPGPKDIMRMEKGLSAGDWDCVWITEKDAMKWIGLPLANSISDKVEVVHLTTSFRRNPNSTKNIEELCEHIRSF